MATRQLKLAAFMRPVSIHTGAWRYPGAWPGANFNFPHLRQLIRKLEAGKFDAFFMADHLAVLNRAMHALNRRPRVCVCEARPTNRNVADPARHIATAPPPPPAALPRLTTPPAVARAGTSSLP